MDTPATRGVLFLSYNVWLDIFDYHFLMLPITLWVVETKRKEFSATDRIKNSFSIYYAKRFRDFIGYATRIV